ncbi:MAG: phosphoglucosamine mutase [Gammaproteobacteria bacterium]|nr:phosphoglucosamine mutase [Gammaproteobacteria bacterium]
MEKRFFGTDGIRGRVGSEPITPEFIMKLGWAAGRVFAERGGGSVLIGKDTRISGYIFESALEAGFSAAGINVSLLGPMPTPAIAYLTRTFKGCAGVVISASHNPYYDNGIKFFSAAGTKVDDGIELAIEALLDEPMKMVDSNRIGKVTRIDDAPGRYIEFCKSTFPAHGSLAGMCIVLDCAHGATYHVAPSVFRELGAEVLEMGVQPNGLNINDGVGSTAPEAMALRVRQSSADLGIAFDGDGDRVIMVDSHGEVVDGDELLYLMTRVRVEENRLQGGVVGTLMTNYGLELALREMDVPFVRAAVGDRHVMAELTSRGWHLGGENSGHLLSLDRTTTGDAIISALQVIAALSTLGGDLHELKSGMHKLPQVMINVRADRMEALEGLEEVTNAVVDTEKQLGGSGRVLLRRSGTESVVRVMVEGQEASTVQSLCETLAERVEQALKA